MAQGNFKETIAAIWTLFVFFVIAIALWGEAILNFIKELFVLTLVSLIAIGIILLLIWYFFLRD